MGDKKKKLVYHIVARKSGPDANEVDHVIIYREYMSALGIHQKRRLENDPYFLQVKDYLRQLDKERKIEDTRGASYYFKVNVDKLITPSWRGWGGKHKSKALLGKKSLGKFDSKCFSQIAKKVWHANNQGNFGFEEKIWEATLQYAPKQQKPLLQKLFAILKYGRLQYRRDSGGEFKPWPHSLAAALSHGGRILVQLPPSRDPKKLLDFGIKADRFMMEFLQGVEYDFRMATHSIHPNSPRVPRDKWLKEKKGSWGPMQHIGINLALGGNNRQSRFVDCWSKRPLAEPNGRHGHMYLGYLQPYRETKTLRLPPNWQRYRGFLIGIEGSTPLLRDVVGHYHGPKATSSIMKVAGGIKWTFVDIREKPGEYDCMFVNLASQELVTKVNREWSRIHHSIVRERTVGYAPPARPPRGRCPRHPDQPEKCPRCN